MDNRETHYIDLTYLAKNKAPTIQSAPKIVISGDDMVGKKGAAKSTNSIIPFLLGAMLGRGRAIKGKLGQLEGKIKTDNSKLGGRSNAGVHKVEDDFKPWFRGAPDKKVMAPAAANAETRKMPAAPNPGADATTRKMPVRADSGVANSTRKNIAEGKPLSAYEVRSNMPKIKFPEYIKLPKVPEILRGTKISNNKVIRELQKKNIIGKWNVRKLKMPSTEPKIAPTDKAAQPPMSVKQSATTQVNKVDPKPDVGNIVESKSKINKLKSGVWNREQTGE
jgi:hypothetical protein